MTTVAKLRKELEEEARHFADAGDGIPMQRKAVIRSLSKVVSYLKSNKVKEGLEPLIALLGGLADIEKGRQASLLAPANQDSALPGSAYNDCIAAACVVMELFVEQGMTKDEAAQYVAGAMTRNKIKPVKSMLRKSVPVWKQMKKWRNDIRSEEKDQVEFNPFWDSYNAAKTRSATADQELQLFIKRFRKK